MFIGVCLIAAGLHVGTQIYKKIETKRKLTKNKSGKDDLCLPEESKELEYGDGAKQETTAEVNRYFKLSVISTGLSLTGNFIYAPLNILSGGILLYALMPILKRVKKAVFQEHKIRIEILDSVGVITALAGRYYFLSSFCSVLYYMSQKLRISTENSSIKSMTTAFGKQASFVWIIKDQVELKIPFEDIKAGDVLVINAGESIPADGIIEYGIASIDQNMLTGESQPAEKGAGEQVFASTILISGKIYIRVEKAGRETVASKIGDIMRNTVEYTSLIESRGQRIADKTVIPAFVLSAVSLPIVGSAGAIALLNCSFFDNMRVFSPISVLNFLKLSSEKGILIKDGRSLELLKKIDTIVFDKTGTLTRTRPRVSNVYEFNGALKNNILAYAAAAEYRQSHPIAKAIIKKAQQEGVKIPEIDEASYKIGYGITVKVAGSKIRVGSSRFMESEKIDIPDSFESNVKKSNDLGCSLIYISIDRDLIGAIELEPAPRPEIKHVLEKLRERNIRFYILSGDHEEPTKSMAQSLGIDNYFAQVLPEDKAKVIEKLQKDGKKVCFIGDGINDSIALKKANLSISMSGASTIATDSAQIVFMDQSLEKLPEIFELSEKFEKNLKGILNTIGVSATVAASGVFLVGLRLPAVMGIYMVSLIAGTGIAASPAFRRKREIPLISNK